MTKTVSIKAKLERSLGDDEVNRKVPKHIIAEANTALNVLKRVESVATANACGDRAMQTNDKVLLESVETEVKQADLAWKGLVEMQKSARDQ